MAASCERLTNNVRYIEMRLTNGGDNIQAVYSPPATSNSSMRGSDPRPRGEERRYHIYDRTNVLNVELLNSITDNRIEEVNRILREGGCVNATCMLTHTSAVHLASMEGRSELLQILLDRGAVPNRIDLEGRSPLHLATRYGHADCARILVSRCPQLVNARVGDEHHYPGEVGGINCDLHDHEHLRTQLPRLDLGSTPLHIASQFAHLPCVELLLEAGADVNTADDQGLTPLDVVGEHVLSGDDEGRSRSSQDLLTGEDEGHSISSQHSNSFLRVVHTLTAAGAAPGKSRDIRHTPVHAAVRLRSVDAIPLLKTAGYSALCWDKTRSHAVHVAVTEQTGPELEALLSAYGQPATALVNGTGFTPLHLAVMAEWLQGITILLNAGADVTMKTTEDSRGHELETVLHLAARNAYSGVLRELLKAPRISEVMDAPSADGQTPLFHAVLGRSLECVQLLLAANADPTKTDNKHRTVLHWAVEYNLPDVLSALFEHRFDAMERIKDATCTWGLLQGTALHIAAYIGDAECVKILVERGCDTRKTMRLFERSGYTALHLAANSGRPDVMRTLLYLDPGLVHVTASDGWMPIHLSCQYGLKECVHLLIAAGSDLSAKCKTPDGSMRTAMDLLVRRVRSPVAVLREVFDSLIGYTPQIDTYVDIDYKVLLPDRTRSHDDVTPIPELNPPRSLNTFRANQMKVIDALLQTGDQQEQQGLLMHPLVESFLYLQWKTLSGFYYGLIVTYTVYILSFTAMVVGIYTNQDKGDFSSGGWGDSTLWRVIVMITLLLLIIHEVILLLQTWLGYFLNFESWLKMCCYCLSLVVTFVDHRAVWPVREMTSAAILMAWVEFMFLISRVPRFGYCVLMFTKVATNLFKVLLTFAFLIIGFAISFMVEFRLEPPFNSTSEAFIKTIVMMTGEFDYSGLFDDFIGEEYSRVFAKSILILFVLLVSIVLMNLLVAMAVTDIKDLDTQGKIDRLRKEAEFVSMFEKIIFDNVFLNWLPYRVRLFMQHYKQAPTSVQLCVSDETKDGIYFPEKLRRSILDKANSNRESQMKEKKRDLKVLELDEKKIREEQIYKELSNKLNYLVVNLETKHNNDERLYRDIVRRIEELKFKQNGEEIDGNSSVSSSQQTLVFPGDTDAQQRFGSGEIQQIKNRLYSLENDQQDMREQISLSFKDFDKKLDILLTRGVSREESIQTSTARNKSAIENLIRNFEIEKTEILIHQREILEHIGSLVVMMENKCSD